jgi:hypothetical protein
VDPLEGRPVPQPHLQAFDANDERPLVSLEGWTRFEQRARQRRIDRRLEATRAALRDRRFADARAALTEVWELEPSHPDIPALERELEAADRFIPARPALGPLVAAAAAFAGITLAATWLGPTGFLPADRMRATAEFAPLPSTTLVAPDLFAEVPVATTGSDLTTRPASRLLVLVEPSLDLPAQNPVQNSVAAWNLPADSVSTPMTVVAASFEPPPVAVFVPTALPNGAVFQPPAGPLRDDEQEVRAVLQQYQRAYEQLDARLAQTVWPAVNESALARAFEGLESQTLTFDACDVQLRGAVASATCRGWASYVPKVGSREPRLEPRVWSFTLRRNTSEWEIDSARADR